MQTTHPAIWELRQCEYVLIPSGTDIKITNEPFTILYVPHGTPEIVLMTPYFEPIHLGGCI